MASSVLGSLLQDALVGALSAESPPNGPPPPRAPAAPRAPLLPPGAPPLPSPPSAPMVAPPNLLQPDALVYMSLVLSLAVPMSIVIKGFEERAEGAALEYAIMPVWLVAAYGFSAAGFSVLFADMNASALTSMHWGFAALASLCALRHSQRVCESPKKPSSTLLLSLAIVLGVIFAFRTSPRLERCRPTIMVLFVFAAAPAYRVYAKHKVESGQHDQKIRSARRRQHLLILLMITMIAGQPWLGVCGPIDRWAESVQMVSDLTILALATDSFW